MKTLFVRKEIAYTGEQLRALWTYETFGLAGDSIVAFQGPCDVRPEFMLDLEDLRAGAEIKARLMLHFIAELFDAGLREAVLQQRLLVSVIAEIIKGRLRRLAVERKGDDLFVERRKLTVSIATVSPVSSLIHLGINIDSIGSPIPAASLKELGAAADWLANDVLAAYAAEQDQLHEARCKVRPAIGKLDHPTRREMR